MCAFCDVCEQINSLKHQIRELELTIQTHKKWCAESEANLKNMKQQFESVRSERNICSRNVLAAKVSDVR